jgi:hypothetical protein
VQIKTQLVATGGTTTGFVIPEDVVAELGSGRKPAVQATVNGHSWRTSIAFMGGRFLLGASAAVRSAAGIAAGDDVDLDIVLDTAPREIATPDDLAAALRPHPEVAAHLAGLSYSKRRAIIENIEGAKTDATRERRVAKAVEQLQAEVS